MYFPHNALGRPWSSRCFTRLPAAGVRYASGTLLSPLPFMARGRSLVTMGPHFVGLLQKLMLCHVAPAKLSWDSPPISCSSHFLSCLQRQRHKTTILRLWIFENTPAEFHTSLYLGCGERFVFTGFTIQPSSFTFPGTFSSMDICFICRDRWKLLRSVRLSRGSLNFVFLLSLFSYHCGLNFFSLSLMCCSSPQVS